VLMLPFGLDLIPNLVARKILHVEESVETWKSRLRNNMRAYLDLRSVLLNQAPTNSSESLQSLKWSGGLAVLAIEAHSPVNIGS
jgi:hypothetical protein